MPDADFYDKVESEILAGLGNEREALYDAWANTRFYEGEFDEFPTRWPDEDGYDRQEQYRRTSYVMNRAVTLMTQDLYKHEPVRTLATTDGTAWLATVYKENAMGAKWQRADELAAVGDFAAFQFVGHDDPDCPVKVHLWGRDQLVVWVDPDDPTEPAAVATLDCRDAGRRLTLWTPEEVVKYATEKGDGKPGSGGTAWREVDRAPNPYREAEVRPGDSDSGEPRGILPFAFVHFKFPAQKFDTPGPGTSLRRLNDHVGYRLDVLGEAVRYLSRPIGVAEGVSAEWKPPARLKPGSWIKLQGESVDVTGNGPIPRLYYVTPPTEFVHADWEDLNAYLDHEMQMHGLPPSVFRMIQSAAASGVALLAEQAPLLKWVEGRQEPFSHYERRAALVCLRVAAAHIRNHGGTTAAAKLDALAAAKIFNLRWGPLYMLLPGPEKDAADQWRMDAGIANPITILMERERLSEDEAKERLKTLAEQKKFIESLGVVQEPPSRTLSVNLPGQEENQDPEQAEVKGGRGRGGAKGDE